MHLSHVLLAIASLVSHICARKLPYAAVDVPFLGTRKDSKCPSVWTQVKAELNTLFMTGDQCNDLARAAIRAVFHDCGSWDTTQGLTGGCDGSLVVGVTPNVELDRTENRGLQTIAAKIKDLSTKYGTSVADMVVFAGTICLCPGGPRVKTFIGRKDSTVSAPPGGIPSPFDSAPNLLNLFAKKGFSAEDLAALLGAHSTSTQKFVDPSQANKSQDSTPGQWDVNYYKETYSFATTGKKDDKVFVLPSDSKLATFDDVGKKFQGFIGNQGKWTSSFANAMERMVLFGNDKGDMVDCTSALG
uniref:Peroxidase n=1 Tax=Coniochaeta hoffmannii TaxID=91930 RepID=A0A2I7VT82_9PEZI|nr:putative generic peroxidase [Coniochaeta hoffmannii]